MDQIIFNDVRLELEPNTLIAITSQINNLSDLKDHKSTLSNTIKVPPTNNNLHALGNSDRVQSETLIPYKKNRARIVKLGVDAIKNGFAEVRSIDSNINLVIYEGNLDFFAAIDGKTLYDLDLSDFNHTYDLTTILSFNSATSGVKYPLIDYGHLTNTNRITDAKNYRPLIFCFELLNRIFSQSGFTAIGDVLTNPNWLKEIIPFTNGSTPKLWYNETIYNLVTDDNTVIVGGIPNGYINGQEVTIGPGPIFLPTYHYDIDLNVYIRVKITSSVGTNYVQAYFNDGGSFSPYIIGGDGIQEIKFSRSAPGIGKTALILLARNCNVEILGGRIFGTITPRDPSEGGPKPISFYVMKRTWTVGNTPETIYVGFAEDGGEEYYEPFAMQNFLPDMTQKDYVKWFAQQFHVMFKTSFIEKKIYLKQFKEIVADCPNALDWTSKLNSDQLKNNLDFKVDGYAKNNLCKYTEDSDDLFIKKGLGDGSISVDDETLALETTALEFPFAATAMELMMQDVDIAKIHKLDENDQFTLDTVPRVLIDLIEPTGMVEITYENGSASQDVLNVPTPYFILKSQEFNLGFNNSILKDNYSALTQVLNKSKRVTVWMKISPVDFYNLDHFKPIYLAQYSAYFYINKVINYTGVGLTKVELIRIGIRNQGLLGMVKRCTLEDGDYRIINRLWPDGVSSFTLKKMILNGTDYATGQTILIDAPGDLLVGVGLDGSTNYIMNINDWINSILPSGWKFYDDMTSLDHPADSTYNIVIKYNYDPNYALGFEYGYTNAGFGLDGYGPFANNICNLL